MAFVFCVREKFYSAVQSDFFLVSLYLHCVPKKELVKYYAAVYILCSYAYRMGDDRKVFDVAAYLEEQGRPEELSLIFFLCVFLSFFYECVNFS